MVVVHFGIGGPSLWGLFESKGLPQSENRFHRGVRRCGLRGRGLKKGVREIVIQRGKDGPNVLVTFSCLPLSQIRASD